jgi:PAS domain-containing protein
MIPTDAEATLDGSARSAHELQTIIDTIPTQVWSTRPDGSAEFLNQRWLDYTGLSADQARDWCWTVDRSVGPRRNGRLAAPAHVRGEPHLSAPSTIPFSRSSSRSAVFTTSALSD